MNQIGAVFAQRHQSRYRPHLTSTERSECGTVERSEYGTVKRNEYGTEYGTEWYGVNMEHWNGAQWNTGTVERSVMEHWNSGTERNGTVDQCNGNSIERHEYARVWNGVRMEEWNRTNMKPNKYGT